MFLSAHRYRDSVHTCGIEELLVHFQDRRWCRALVLNPLSPLIVSFQLLDIRLSIVEGACFSKPRLRPELVSCSLRNGKVLRIIS